MELLKFVRLSFVVISMVLGKRKFLFRDDIKHLSNEHMKLINQDPAQGLMMCAKLSKEPYFRLETLLGRTWRMYYAWNMDLRSQCLDMGFRNVTPAIIRRFYNNMNTYLESEPNWDAATVLIRMSRARHEMLLFAAQEPVGRFRGVPDLIRERSIGAPGKMVPLLQFQLKLMYGGKYLLMSDCQIGVTTLSALRQTLPHRAEIDSIVNHLDFGPGLHACLSDKNKNENASKK